ncbi:MAG: hypothetical protein ACXW20_16315, partial [Burkholderiales bacterium]
SYGCPCATVLPTLPRASSTSAPSPSIEEVEHQSAKALIAEIEEAKPGDHLFDAKVTVLGKYVKHHVKEEAKRALPETAKEEARPQSAWRKTGGTKKAELAGD